jgi:hypothetical protein
MFEDQNCQTSISSLEASVNLNFPWDRHSPDWPKYANRLIGDPKGKIETHPVPSFFLRVLLFS